VRDFRGDDFWLAGFLLRVTASHDVCDPQPSDGLPLHTTPANDNISPPQGGTKPPIVEPMKIAIQAEIGLDVCHRDERHQTGPHRGVKTSKHRARAVAPCDGTDRPWNRLVLSRVRPQG
jgi:hypothetical protein